MSARLRDCAECGGDGLVGLRREWHPIDRCAECGGRGFQDPTDAEIAAAIEAWDAFQRWHAFAVGHDDADGTLGAIESACDASARRGARRMRTALRETGDRAMRYRVNAKNLDRAVKLAAIASKCAPSWIRGVALEADADGFRVSGTDLETSVSIRCSEQTGAEYGRVIVAPKALRAALRGVSGWVSLADRDGALRVTLPDGGEIAVPTTAHADAWPDAPLASVEPGAPIDGTAFRSALASVRHAMSKDATRTNLTGAYLECTGDGAVATMTATDGHRLMHAPACALPLPPSVALANIVPPQAVALILAAIAPKAPRGAVAPVVRFAVGDRGARLDLDSGESIAFRFIEGEYPSWRQVIPRAGDYLARTSRNALADMMARAVAAAKNAAEPRRFPVVRVRLNDRVEVAPVEIADNEETLGAMLGAAPCSWIRHDGAEEPDVRVGFNPSYMADALEALPGRDEATIAFVSNAGEVTADAPVVIRGAGDAFAVVMPVRLSERTFRM